MKKLALLSILLCFCFVSADDAFARRGHRGHHRGGVSIGLAVGPYWGWGPHYHAPLYYPYYHHAPVVIERQAPPVYIEQSSPAPAANYWYYCQASNGYYPHVKECPAGWLRVLP